MSALSRLHTAYDAVFQSYPQEMLKALTGCASILDVGCGSGSPVAQMRGKARLAGVDAHAASIETARKRGTHDELHVHDVLKIGELFPEKSFDAVAALDLIEHLEKKDGLSLLATLERLARKKVVIFTPNGFLKQGEYDNNPWQIHRSGWEVDEMRAKGYAVIGINGWRTLRGELGYIKWRPAAPWIVFSDLTQLFVRNWPEKAFQLLCVKTLQ